jgi:hypothetical protein
MDDIILEKDKEMPSLKWHSKGNDRVSGEVCASSAPYSLRNRRRKLYMFAFTVKEGRSDWQTITSVGLCLAAVFSFMRRLF